MKILKSIGAVLAGLVFIFIVSSLTDLVLEKTGAMKLPFSLNPLWMMIVVVLYRCMYVSLGAYITASLAPRHPVKHAMILAAIGCMLGIAGAIVMWHEPPHWYPVALIILGWPFSWLGAKARLRNADTIGAAPLQ